MAFKNFILNGESVTCVGLASITAALANTSTAVTGTSSNNADYVSVTTNTTADVAIFGELLDVSTSVADSTSLGTSRTFCTVKIRGLLRVQVGSAYAATNFGNQIVSSTTAGEAGFSTTAGIGFVVGGETVGTDHFAFVVY